jgi:hypothetical protein
MRSLFAVILGGLLVFAFFWYRGDTGTIQVGPFELESPREKPLLDRLAELQEEGRAIGGDFLSAGEAAPRRLGTEMYAGHLIAKPKAAAAETAPGLVGVASFGGSTLTLAPAFETARRVGDVEQGLGNTLLINVDFDLAPVRELSTERIGIESVGSGFRASVDMLSTTGGQRVVQAVSGGERLRERVEASTNRARQLVYRDTECDARARQSSDPQARLACTVEELQASGNFEYVEKNFIVATEMSRKRGSMVVTPSDPLYGFQWHFMAQGDGEGKSPGGAGFAEFWAKKRQVGSRSVTVAVIDTGLDMSLPDIAGSANIAPGVDMISLPFYGNDGNGRDMDPSDPGDICDENDPYAENSYHGTHVAGTVGAVGTNNGEGVAGGAWEVTIVPVRALGKCGGLSSDVAEAIRWAAGVDPVIVESDDGGTFLYQNANPADVINLSLGFMAPNGCTMSMQSAINDAVAAGAIVVAAAGNAGVDIAKYAPSGCQNVIAVAAGDAEGALTPYSNWGALVDIMAPGGDMTKDANGDGRPDGVLSTRRDSDCRDPITNGVVQDCYVSFLQGTSMAAPHVSAALALLKSDNPDASADQLIAMLVNDGVSPRTPEQCTVACGRGGGTPLAADPAQCQRACGNGLLNLGKLAK